MKVPFWQNHRNKFKYLLINSNKPIIKFGFLVIFGKYKFEICILSLDLYLHIIKLFCFDLATNELKAVPENLNILYF